MKPIEKFIQNRLQSLGIRKSKLVQLLGYQNISKGLRRLERFLKGEFIFPKIQESLLEVLQCPREELSLVMAATEKVRKEEFMRQSKEYWEERLPMALVITEKAGPPLGQISIFGLINLEKKRLIPLPKNLLILDTPSFQMTVKKEVTHYRKILGKAFPILGRILGYTLFLKWKNGIRPSFALDEKGDLLNEIPEGWTKYRPNPISMRI